MNTINFSGLASGMDTASLIKSLVQIERLPIKRLEEQKTAFNGQASRFNEIKTRLQKLSDAAKALDARDEILSARAISSQEEAVAVTTTGGASTGSYDILVTSTAKSHRTYSDAFASKSQTGLFGTGTLSIQVGAEAAFDVNVTASDTLESVVNKINAQGGGVTAGILFDGTEYRLQVSGNATGTSNAVTFTEGAGLTLGLSNPANVKQTAADAVFSIDGFPMTSASNTVSGAIPGVTLTLKKETTGTAQLQIDRDAGSLGDKLQSFVDAYNNTMRYLNAQSGNIPGVARSADSIGGDSTVRTIQSRLRSEAGQILSGRGDVDRLLSLGIKTNGDGTLTLDRAALETKVAADPEGVANLLRSADAPSTDHGVMRRFQDLVKSFTDGKDSLISSRTNSIGNRTKALDRQIERMEENIVKFEQRLRKQYSAMEQVISGLQSQGSQLASIMASL